TDAATGRPAFLSAARPADLAAAVAASCAIPGVLPAVRIDGHLFIDGGLRSPANLDVAGSARAVVALAPLTGSVRAHRRPADQAAQLRRAGVTVALLTPDSDGRRAIGLDPLAAGRVPAAFDAGRRLGGRHAVRIGQVWSADDSLS
ncbi:patatin-like phospholipase family protein, partial [Propionicimonas sp.]|uniref:patatin-like phospholipase family protein n=1 Tax=Propionicimonas sp. TaxID=1955623 RepID=UPI0039E540FE